MMGMRARLTLTVDAAAPGDRDPTATVLTEIR